MTAQRIVRDWQVNRARVAVSTNHPTLGEIRRGTIHAVTTTDWRGAWTLVNYEHERVGEGPFVGDYLDAEAALLAATAELD
jgi:hypothetical protein